MANKHRFSDKGDRLSGSILMGTAYRLTKCGNSFTIGGSDLDIQLFATGGIFNAAQFIQYNLQPESGCCRGMCMFFTRRSLYRSSVVRIQLDIVVINSGICFDARFFSCRCGSTAFAY